MTGTPEWKSWSAMQQRCYNKNYPGFHNYGGRGIRVFGEWRRSFLKFFAYIGKRPSPPPSERGPLGQYLWTLRKAVDMSLREVEDASEKKVSNAYLSQLETGRITNPSPGILHEIATVYAERLPKNASVSCSYERMMELAGHIRPSSQGPTKKTSRLPTFAGEQLTPEEEDELLKYLAFIRMRKGKK